MGAAQNLECDLTIALADDEASLEIHRFLGNKTGISYVRLTTAALHWQAGNNLVMERGTSPYVEAIVAALYPINTCTGI